MSENNSHIYNELEIFRIFFPFRAWIEGNLPIKDRQTCNLKIEVVVISPRNRKRYPVGICRSSVYQPPLRRSVVLFGHKRSLAVGV